MTNSENRILRLEAQIRTLLQQVQDLQIKLGQVAQNQYAQNSGAGAGGGGGNCLFCLPTTLNGASGSWPSLTPASQSLTVYQVNGTTITSLGAKTVYNWYPAATVASKVVQLAVDVGGNFVVVAQSCT